MVRKYENSTIRQMKCRVQCLKVEIKSLFLKPTDENMEICIIGCSITSYRVLFRVRNGRAAASTVIFLNESTQHGLGTRKYYCNNLNFNYISIFETDRGKV